MQSTAPGQRCAGTCCGVGQERWQRQRLGAAAAGSPPAQAGSPHARSVPPDWRAGKAARDVLLAIEVRRVPAAVGRGLAVLRCVGGRVMASVGQPRVGPPPAATPRSLLRAGRHEPLSRAMHLPHALAIPGRAARARVRGRGLRECRHQDLRGRAAAARQPLTRPPPRPPQRSWLSGECTCWQRTRRPAGASPPHHVKHVEHAPAGPDLLEHHGGLHLAGGRRAPTSVGRALRVLALCGLALARCTTAEKQGGRPAQVPQARTSFRPLGSTWMLPAVPRRKRSRPRASGRELWAHCSAGGEAGRRPQGQGRQGAGAAGAGLTAALHRQVGVPRWATHQRAGPNLP